MPPITIHIPADDSATNAVDINIITDRTHTLKYYFSLNFSTAGHGSYSETHKTVNTNSYFWNAYCCSIIIKPTWRNRRKPLTIKAVYIIFCSFTIMFLIGFLLQHNRHSRNISSVQFPVVWVKVCQRQLWCWDPAMRIGCANIIMRIKIKKKPEIRQAWPW